MANELFQSLTNLNNDINGTILNLNDSSTDKSGIATE